MLAEGGLTVALALALSYLKIPVAALGGSIDFVMVPLIVFAYRWGVWQGLLAGLAFGTLKFFLAGGSAINWQSMLLDYSVAYAFVGFAGLIHKKKGMLPVSALIGCIARFIIHFISGVTIYAEYAEPTADFFNCVAFGKTAEFVQKYFAKGMKINLEGRMRVQQVGVGAAAAPGISLSS